MKVTSTAYRDNGYEQFGIHSPFHYLLCICGLLYWKSTLFKTDGDQMILEMVT